MEGEVFSNDTMTIYIPVGKSVNVSLNITGGSLAEFNVELVRFIYINEDSDHGK